MRTRRRAPVWSWNGGPPRRHPPVLRYPDFEQFEQGAGEEAVLVRLPRFGLVVLVGAFCAEDHNKKTQTHTHTHAHFLSFVHAATNLTNPLLRTLKHAGATLATRISSFGIIDAKERMNAFSALTHSYQIVYSNCEGQALLGVRNRQSRRLRRP